jgi:trehalose 6-phosphate phosphatase
MGVSRAATLDDALAPLLADPARAAVLLDVDGTLAPIVRHADDAHVPEPTRAPLIAVARRYGLVACISGRRAATARRMVSLGTITYVGNHGTEILRGGATTPEVDPEVAA